MLTINTVVNACFSGEIPDNRVVFAMLGLTTFLPEKVYTL